MKNDHYVWLTLFDKLFKKHEYLYHFTDIEKASKILHGATLKFSKLSRTNDTLESKPRINEKLGYSDCIEQFKKLNQECVQLLCFSTDDYVDDNKISFTVTERMKYSDYTGRGFALPRMWAQYAKNNSGICLIFNKKKLTEIIKEQLGENYILGEMIDYKSPFEEYPLINEREELIKLLIKDVEQLHKTPINAKFLKEHIDFVKYNYFSKLDDWATEKEFRFLAYGENEYLIHGIFDTLVGIIVGEKTDVSDIEIIKMFADKFTDIKKVSFTFNGCKLENLN